MVRGAVRGPEDASVDVTGSVRGADNDSLHGAVSCLV